MKRNRVIITGISGFIGANIVRKMVNLGYDVYGFSKKKSNTWRLDDVMHSFNYFDIDINKKDAVHRLVTKIRPHIIYHLASFGGYPFQSDPLSIINTNIGGTVNMLSSLKTIDFDVFVNFGSSSEYGRKRKPMKETDFLDPISLYAAAKAGSTYIANVYSHMLEKPVITVRPFSVYGPFEEPTRLIPTVIQSALMKKDILITSGHESRDFIFIDDFVDALLLLTQNPKRVKAKVINIGSGKQYSVSKVVSMINKITNSSAKIIYGEYNPRPWDTEFWVADITLAKKQLSWRPRHSIHEGLKKTINWFRNNGKLYEKATRS
ncbi:NAD-dependent epimerase/dehydratase family protein [Candidatus Gottesmanbacteria bacterium]|nr:NAD-dependent epimerase/dehydratase family protein [Candidatus Gottesmanbacteria bacterium]